MQYLSLEAFQTPPSDTLFLTIPIIFQAFLCTRYFVRETLRMPSTIEFTACFASDFDELFRLARVSFPRIYEASMFYRFEEDNHRNVIGT